MKDEIKDVLNASYIYLLGKHNEVEDFIASRERNDLGNLIYSSLFASEIIFIVGISTAAATEYIDLPTWTVMCSLTFIDILCRYASIDKKYRGGLIGTIRSSFDTKEYKSN